MGWISRLFGKRDKTTILVRKVPIEPGDVLMVRYDGILSFDMRRRIEEHVKSAIDAPVMVYGRDVEIDVLNRKGGVGYTRSGLPIPPPPDWDNRKSA